MLERCTSEFTSPLHRQLWNQLVHKYDVEESTSWISDKALKESCSHRKTYTIHGNQYAKCDGKVFYVPDFSRYPMEDMVALIREIYPMKKYKP